MTIEKAIEVLKDMCAEQHPSYGGNERVQALTIAIDELKESQ
jgi:ribosomal protein L31